MVKKKKTSEKQQMAAEIVIVNNLLMWRERERERLSDGTAKNCFPFCQNKLLS